MHTIYEPVCIQTTLNLLKTITALNIDRFNLLSISKKLDDARLRERKYQKRTNTTKNCQALSRPLLRAIKHADYRALEVHPRRK